VAKFSLTFVCYLGDETDGKAPVRKQIASDSLLVVPRQGEIVSMHFGPVMVRSVVTLVQHILTDYDAPGLVVTMRALAETPMQKSN
jgi:hypothetical protein